MGEIGYTNRTCVIVVEVEGDSGNLPEGIVGDSVSEVLNIKGDHIEDTPAFGTGLGTDCVSGMTTPKGRVKILLDIDRVLHHEEMSTPGVDAGS